jgi:CRP-like cAMP-binding protein
MIDRLINNNFLKYGLLSPEEIEAILQSTEIKEFKKGDFLLREGQKSINTYFVLRGCIRQYNLSNGDEKTTRFFFEDDWVLSVNEVSENATSLFNWICLEDCTLVSGNEQKAQELFVNFPRLETISRRIVEDAFSKIQKSVLSYYSESPEQRYLSLIKTQSNIIQRVPQYYLASYLGIQPESLSRIKKRIAKNYD